MSGSSTRPSATRWKLAVLRGLGDREVVAILEAAVLGVFTLPKAVAVSVAWIKIGLFIQLLILYFATL